MKFKKALYRIIDGFPLDDDVQKMRTIEAEIFGVIKVENKEFQDQWEGSLDQNLRADEIVASAIRTSFQLYEKNKNKQVDDEFFKF